MGARVGTRAHSDKLLFYMYFSNFFNHILIGVRTRLALNKHHVVLRERAFKVRKSYLKGIVLES